MKSLDSWLAEYSESHQNKTNQLVHRICVPLILWSIVGFSSLLRMGDSIWTSAAPALCLAVLVFYFMLGLKPFAEMVVQLGICLALCAYLENRLERAWILYAAVFVTAWIGQAAGHAIEGKKPSFFKDLQFLLIGPLWIVRKHG